MLSKLHLIEQKISQKQLRVLLIAMAILTILRLISVFWSPYSLQVDEAQYAGWARSFSAGYYSKPPFIAWILGVGQTVCSTLNIHQVEGCTRMLQAPALFIASLFIMASAWQLFEEYAIALLSGLIFITLPFVGFYSLVATTDAWLLMWWSMTRSTGRGHERVFCPSLSRVDVSRAIRQSVFFGRFCGRSWTLSEPGRKRYIGIIPPST